MIKTFKERMFLVILVFIFFCSGCTTEEKAQTQENTKNNPVPTMVSDTANTGKDTKTYKATLADNLIVDATVDVSDVKDIPTLQVTGKVFDKNELLNTFLGSKDIKEKKEGGQSTYIVSNKSLTIHAEPGRFNFITPLGDYVKSIIDSRDEVSKFKSAELDFVAKSKATEQVTALIKTLDITSHTSPEIYALDYNTLQQEQDGLMKDKNYKYFVDLGKTRIKEKWTKDDECYYMVFRIDMNGIPCSNTNFTMQSLDAMISGSELGVIISKDGIESFNINGVIYEQKNSKVKTSGLISMEQALESLKKKYSNVILKEEAIITGISMVYLPVITKLGTVSEEGVSSNREIEMVPCWYFNIKQKYTKAGKVNTIDIVVHINAIDGKEIL
ncbi:MAG: hypothetical protein H7Y18_04025 [Clostridiaceae bacterium]|nr:hypothetical protein [Clostridiaceae bacterium]